MGCIAVCPATVCTTRPEKCCRPGAATLPLSTLEQKHTGENKTEGKVTGNERSHDNIPGTAVTGGIMSQSREVMKTRGGGGGEGDESRQGWLRDDFERIPGVAIRGGRLTQSRETSRQRRGGGGGGGGGWGGQGWGSLSRVVEKNLKSILGGLNTGGSSTQSRETSREARGGGKAWGRAGGGGAMVLRERGSETWPITGNSLIQSRETSRQARGGGEGGAGRGRRRWLRKFYLARLS